MVAEVFKCHVMLVILWPGGSFESHSDSVNFTQNDFYNDSNVKKVTNRKYHKVENALHRYCIDVDGASLESNAEETCDYKVNLTSDELKDLSVLSDPIFNLTRGLYNNNIWNPNNYIVFMLHEGNQEFGSEVRSAYESDIGQKYGVHVQSQNVIKYFESISTADVDYSVTVDSCVLCFVTPHSQLMPQYLVIFKAFTPVVWYFIVITITIFILMQHLFQKIFRAFYSDAERSSYEGSSSMLTIFSYFICGSPPRLLLGRFYTGKVLFTVFSFATIIISTVFLDGMTTLLTKQVRYPEIDSLKDMEDASIFIQVLDAEKASRFFLQENKYKTLATKLTHSSFLLEDVLTNSFLFEKFNNKLAQMLEAGHAEKDVQPVLRYWFNTTERGEPRDQCEPRPYELRDLRLAFMALSSDCNRGSSVGTFTCEVTRRGKIADLLSQSKRA
ncbi:unnamed protein product [Bemisia tabaci]|uniref:Ionotropic receptor n=1 Tax=Bemisia tabaci TaxID=7038 RepID=A0A9P0F4A8_BEMTA|nr:unnamed protein product [Bemisia tabaci]